MDKKQKAIQAAIELFGTQGYEKTSINAICEHAKVSKGLIFYHFKNKEELLREVFHRIAEIIDEVGKNVNEFNKELSAEERLINLLDHIFLSMTSPEQKLYYQFDFQVLCQPSLRELLKDLLDDRYNQMMESFQAILNDIPSANIVIDSHMLIAEIDGIALNYLFNEENYPLDEIKNRFISKYLLLLGL